MNTLHHVSNQHTFTGFSTYTLTAEDYNNIRMHSAAVRDIAVQDGLPSHALSNLLAAALREHTDIPVEVVAGNVAINGERIFNNGAPHSWVEVPGLILDVSILNIAFEGTVSEHVQHFVQRKFRTPNTTIIATPTQMKQLGFLYGVGK